MTTTIQIFENAEFGKVRTMQSAEGEPLFCAKDVAVALGYKKTRNAIAQHVDEGDALKQGTPTTSGIQQMLYVNESGLYALILGRGAVADIEQLEETRMPLVFLWLAACLSLFAEVGLGTTEWTLVLLEELFPIVLLHGATLFAIFLPKIYQALLLCPLRNEYLGASA